MGRARRPRRLDRPGQQNSAVFKIAKVAEQTVDLTEDVELWYTGAVPNRGWSFVMENDAHVYLPSPGEPYGGGGKQWKLMVTFEPK